MKAYTIGDQTGFASLSLGKVLDPVPGPGEAIVRVRAVCLNHRDLLIANGQYGPKKPAERVPLSEGVGEVSALGDGVTGVVVGDRVVCPHFVSWIGGPFAPSVFAADLGVTRDGWLAEFVRVPAAVLVALPAAVDDDQAASLASSALTAWHALVEVGRVKPGATVLCPGTGGVSLAALLLAKAAGARAVVTSSSDAKLARARDLGADVTINYRTTPDWPTEVVRLTGGADIVVDTGGQATLGSSIAAAAAGGRIVVIGALAGPATSGLANYGTIIGKGLTLTGIAEGSRAMLANLVAAVATNGVRPVIDRRFAFADARDAYAYLDSGAHFGKVMITL